MLRVVYFGSSGSILSNSASGPGETPAVVAAVVDTPPRSAFPLMRTVQAQFRSSVETQGLTEFRC